MNRCFDTEEAATVIADYRSGLSLRKVAKLHYVTSITILNCLKLSGINRRPRNPKREKMMTASEMITAGVIRQSGD